jgi:hypothetical protein
LHELPNDPRAINVNSAQLKYSADDQAFAIAKQFSKRPRTLDVGIGERRGQSIVHTPVSPGFCTPEGSRLNGFTEDGQEREVALVARAPAPLERSAQRRDFGARRDLLLQHPG